MNQKLRIKAICWQNNLNRQILFGFDNIGDKKVKIAKKKLKLINSNCRIKIIDKNININNINSLSECSIIVDASDNWQTSKLLNSFCIKNSINFLYSSVTAHDIQIILFDNSKANEHLCLNCNQLQQL